MTQGSIALYYTWALSHILTPCSRFGKLLTISLKLFLPSFLSLFWEIEAKVFSLPNHPLSKILRMPLKGCIHSQSLIYHSQKVDAGWKGPPVFTCSLAVETTDLELVLRTFPCLFTWPVSFRSLDLQGRTGMLFYFSVVPLPGKHFL